MRGNHVCKDNSCKVPDCSGYDGRADAEHVRLDQLRAGDEFGLEPICGTPDRWLFGKVVYVGSGSVGVDVGERENVTWARETPVVKL